MSYRICPDCGAYLDPCERCDCQDGEDGDHQGWEAVAGKEKAHPVAGGQ